MFYFSSFCSSLNLCQLIWAATWQNQQCDCAPSEDSDQSGRIRVLAPRMKKAWVLCYPLSAQRRLWSDLAVAQADLSLRWAHTHFVGFIMSWLICLFRYLVGLARYAAWEHHANTPPQRDKLCIAQSFSLIFSYLASYFWTIVIALHILIAYTCQTDATSRRIPHIMYHVICWGVPGECVLFI